jgi:dihydrodipicolinate synthase/N-acetylneuraminate lyase
MTNARFITAIGTPQTDDAQLHSKGLAQHIEDQAQGGIDGLLVAGSMGTMPLLTDQTWRDLLRKSIELGRGRFEMLVGATDLGTARAIERIRFVNTLDGIDGVVVLAPGLYKYSQTQYIDYFTNLADMSRYPLYLYDLEPLTGVHLPVETVLTLSKHKNIAGIKLSANVPESLRLHRQLDGAPFRLIISEPVLSDMLFRQGHEEHLDGIYVFAPHWAAALVAAAKRDDWVEAAIWQRKLSDIKELFLTLPIGPLFTGLMNLRGIKGIFMPKPFELPDEAFIETLKQLPVVEELLATTTAQA